ncbi:MAG: hypothetical protein EXQ56_02825 [Acidobacteria bacterium]|nr:hypothetical protein [Acidobacteriota bacterium]
MKILWVAILGIFTLPFSARLASAQEPGTSQQQAAQATASTQQVPASAQQAPAVSAQAAPQRPRITFKEGLVTVRAKDTSARWLV